MVATRVIINWTSYSPTFPEIIDLKTFNEYKFSNTKKVSQIKFNFWKTFFVELTFITLAILFLLGDIYHYYPNAGWKRELIDIFGGICIIIGFVLLLGFIPSAISYISSYLYSRQYINRLNTILSQSNAYKTFCNAMSILDKRYIMHIQRMNNLEK